MRKLLTILIVFMAAISCTEKGETIESESRQETTTIPLSQALDNLNDLLIKLSLETKNMDNRLYCAESITPLGNRQFAPMTKSCDVEIPDTLLYIVNFDGESGFAILSADVRLGESVYCITDNGSISSADFVSAFAFLHSTETKSEFKSDIESDEFYDMGEKFVPALLLSSILADLKYGHIVEEDTKSTTDVTTNTVLLKTKWTQWLPFSRYTRDENGVPSPAGCVAIACASFMTITLPPSIRRGK